MSLSVCHSVCVTQCVSLSVRSLRYRVVFSPVDHAGLGRGHFSPGQQYGAPGVRSYQSDGGGRQEAGDAREGDRRRKRGEEDEGEEDKSEV